ncbi:uncharacterized protein B0I36DRAFT_426986 [Microdochium trichocladiopsis]|uniref:Uncharacterized protein n=1 Tax=Microdochium trichocladiopsis TaxID=1682393 RepID=A0A9P9BVR7_9PEZI|nr:uncharacterized protein B0I36DRAFT_426986 [Microdochium trichocladiopsis]KAH7040573.1 hypothetical protein B0I36DRAFT_426986 [Microdochium trichocladiopsis]
MAAQPPLCTSTAHTCWLTPCRTHLSTYAHTVTIPAGLSNVEQPPRRSWCSSCDPLCPGLTEWKHKEWSFANLSSPLHAYSRAKTSATRLGKLRMLTGLPLQRLGGLWLCRTAEARTVQNKITASLSASGAKTPDRPVKALAEGTMKRHFSDGGGLRGLLPSPYALVPAATAVRRCPTQSLLSVLLAEVQASDPVPSLNRVAKAITNAQDRKREKPCKARAFAINQGLSRGSGWSKRKVHAALAEASHYVHGGNGLRATANTGMPPLSVHERSFAEGIVLEAHETRDPKQWSSWACVGSVRQGSLISEVGSSGTRFRMEEQLCSGNTGHSMPKAASVLCLLDLRWLGEGPWINSRVLMRTANAQTALRWWVSCLVVARIVAVLQEQSECLPFGAQKT